MEMPQIVEKMHDVNQWLLQRVAKFPRDQRLLLGDRLMGAALDIQDLLLAAALAPRGAAKAGALERASLRLEQLRLMLRLALGARCLSKGSWAYCAGNLVEVGKMLGGWRKSLESQSPVFTPPPDQGPATVARGLPPGPRPVPPVTAGE
jgi:hypothetical protein